MVILRPLARSLGCIAISSLAFLAACGGSSSSSNQSTTTTTTSGNNVQSIAVDGGPVPGQIYPNGAFTSVTLCQPGTSTCQTVDGILVDTGSSGLRVLASALTSTFPNVTISGNNAYDCVNFIDGSYLWGPMEQADIEISGEKAGSASFQLIENPTFTIPSGCSNGGVNEDSQSGLGANGILGVGQEPTDCFIDGVSPCLSTVSTSPPNVYFTCGTTGNCQASFVPLAQQLINPVVGFSTDNNGVIIELQSVNDAAATTTGSMIFGIGTESNNALGSATVFTVDPTDDDFTTNFNSVSLAGSFIDSGSNGLFFQDSIPECPGGAFYCPSSTLNLSAQNVGANNAQNTVNFSVDSAIETASGDAAYSNLAGPIATGTCTPSNPNACTFDWGLPFFFGRNVYVSIDGQTMPSGSPAAPWWAY